MPKQTVSVKHAVTMVAMFIVGTAVLVSVGMQAKHDAWMALIIGLAASLLLMLVYARLMSYYPGKDLLDTMDILLGRPLTTVILILMTVFFFQHYSYVLRHFSAFITTVGLPDAPRLVPLVCLGFLTALGVYFGIEVLGKWSQWFLFLVIAFVIVATLLLTKYMKIDHIKPMLENGMGPIIRASWTVLSFPFAQVVAFLFVLPPIPEKKAPYKVFIYGVLLGGVILFTTSIANLLVLGSDSVMRLYFPTYTTKSIIQLGQFLQRLEILAAVIFTLAIFLKAAILLLAVVKLISRILRLKNFAFLAIPVVLLAIDYTYISYDSIIQQYDGIFTFWPWYSNFFQVLIPVLLFVIMEIKYARIKVKNGASLPRGA